jgi:hypothetical protein
MPRAGLPDVELARRAERRARADDLQRAVAADPAAPSTAATLEPCAAAVTLP